MKISNRLILTTSPLTQTARKLRRTASLSHKRFLYRGGRYYLTGKERDIETGLYYFGARYLDSRTGRWISGDPAMADYVPEAPVSDEARKRNGNLPGMGGVFNYVNLHVYHYAGNNPVKYSDPDGMWQIHSTFNFKTGKNDYFMRVPGASTQMMRIIGSFFPGGSYLSNMQNGLSNLINRITATNHSIVYDSSDTRGFDSFSLAMDILSIIPAGRASKIFNALNLGVSTSDGLGNSISWAKDSDIQNFLDGVTFDLFGGVEDEGTATVLGSAIAIGTAVYKDKELENKNISKSTWAMAIKNKVLGGNNSVLDGLYNDVMSGRYND